MWHRWISLLSPKGFLRGTKFWARVLGVLAILLMGYGLFAGLFLVLADYQQGDAFRIIYVHVPCAMLSMSLYFAMALMSFSTYVWRLKIADMLAANCAILGAVFAALALCTGAVWGKPMWGTWWVWDGRLTSELVLFFLYLGVIALRSAIADAFKASRACALLSILGIVNLPIIHFSVNWWHTLHQKSTLLGLHTPTMADSMLWPLLASMAGFCCFAAWWVIQNTRADILSQQQAIDKRGCA